MFLWVSSLVSSAGGQTQQFSSFQFSSVQFSYLQVFKSLEKHLFTSAKKRPLKPLKSLKCHFLKNLLKPAEMFLCDFS